MAEVVNQIQGQIFRKQDIPLVNQGMGEVQKGAERAQQGVQQAYGQLGGVQSNFSNLFNPAAFNTNFRTPGGLDARSKSLFSQQQAQNQSGLAAQQRSVQRQIGATNPGLAQILGQQGQQQAMLASNPAYFQAGQQQEARQQQELQLANQAMLQRTQQQAQLQGQGNDTLLQNASTQANLSALLAQIPQSTLASLFGAAQGMGQQYAATPDQLHNAMSTIRMVGSGNDVEQIRIQEENYKKMLRASGVQV